MSEPRATAVRGGHRLRWVGVFVVGVLLLLAAAVAWIVNTPSGTHWLLARVGGLLGERFAVAQVQGTLRGPLVLDGLRFETEAMRLTAARVSIDPALGALLRWTVHLQNVELQGLDVQLSNAEQEEQSADAFDLQPPIDVVVDRFMLNGAQLRRDEGAPFVLQRADLAGRWTATGIELRQLDAYAPQGQVHLRGRASGAGAYSGEAEGRFRWTVDAQTYAGQLHADTQGERLRLNLNLSQPMPASLQFSLTQSAELPWQMALRVPRFDPREQWSDSTSLSSLSASLSGDGTRSQARLSGNLVINEQPLVLRAVQIERRDDVIELARLEAGIGDSPGALRASGTVNLGETLRAALDVNWTDLRIPQSWVGQTLQTRGQVHVEAGAELYRANGRLALGPPGRLADIALDVNGSPQAVRIDALRIQQPSGFLRASGDLRFGSEIQWRLAAEADSFDPGELLAEWRGDLDLALTSNGRYAAGDVQAALDLKRLGGTLRGRMLSGGGTLNMNARRVLAGDLRLRADASTVDFRGESGDRWNAVLTLDVAALNDWLPQAAGSIQGRFTLNGDWPRIEVAGNAQGRALRVAGLAAEELAVSADVRVPEKPMGELRAEGSGVAAAGFTFTQLQARVSGDEGAHEFEVSALGKPLAFEVNANGGRTADGWQGNVRQLALQVAEVPRLSLQQPAQVTYSAHGFAVSQSCLAGGDIRLCAAGSGSADGALQLSYTLQNVPLALANAAAPDLPLVFDGEIEGRGAVGRDARGSWMGTASLSSSSGSVAQAGLMESPPLLSYANFNLAAMLDGTRASVTVGAQLDQRGRIAGSVALDGVGTARTAVQGMIEADIPSLAALATFTPQLANVSGRAQLQATLAGTLDAPQISGSARVAELGAQLPMLGVQLKDGTLRADARAGAVNLSGDIASGDGRLRFDGTWTAGDGARLTINGERVLLADIPSARVIATPDLRVRWAEQQLRIEGDVSVPTANVNIQKLPRGAKSPRLSDDVVVVDEESAATQADSLPVTAQVTIALGNEVKVSGYGLEATVDGRLTVREQPGEITRGSGDLTVAGTYKAYGQDLTIQKGRVLYADAPLDNPQLDITAVRMIDEVTAGLMIAGPAQQPRISVFSDPAMDEANALSYLVAGRPLDDIGTGEEDGSALQAAARSLGTAGGGLLAKQLGRRLGVDEVSVKEDELIGGAAFTVGQYLSPRLFLSYGVGLFEPGEVVTLRYRLSRTLSLQAQRGSEETRAGLQYRTER